MKFQILKSKNYSCLLFIILFSSFNSNSQSPNPNFLTSGGDYTYKGDFKLIFHDEFDGTSLNKDKWITWFPDQCGDEKPDAWV